MRAAAAATQREAIEPGRRSAGGCGHLKDLVEAGRRKRREICGKFWVFFDDLGGLFDVLESFFVRNRWELFGGT